MKAEQVIASTERYNRKKEAIVAAATGILNRHGARGMTLADVAASVGLITTSVTYYFKKKEDLAVACFLQAIERFDVLISEAARAVDPRERLRVLLGGYFALDKRIRKGEEAPVAVFSDVRCARTNPISLRSTSLTQNYFAKREPCSNRPAPNGWTRRWRRRVLTCCWSSFTGP